MGRRTIDAVVLAAGFLAAAAVHGDGAASSERALPASMTGDAPALMIWAWEEPEDLRAADPQRLGVAFLDERVFVGTDLKIVERRQPIMVPEGMWAEAVVRIEPQLEFADSERLRRSVAAAVLQAAHLPGVRGVQVDFDAKASQRNFYSDVLRQVRADLPHHERLEITALVSWCAQSSGWMSRLPIDAAVPMEFRLGEHVGDWGVREPLCQGSVGISTDETQAAASRRGRRRIFVFAPRPWTARQIAQLNVGEMPQDVKGAR